MKYQLSILANEEKEIIEHEKITFQIFSQKNPDYWICKNYQEIDNSRYRSNIAYKDQIIYVAKENNKIVAAIAINVNSKNIMQFEQVGFSINQNERKKKICEVLILYGLDSLQNDFLKVFMSMGDFLGSDLRKKGFQALYATAIKKYKTFYTLFGSEVIQKNILDNQKKYLLRSLF